MATAALERQIVRAVYQRTSVAIESLPAGVFRDWRGGYDSMVNCNPKPFDAPLPPTAHIAEGRTPPQPAGMLVWKDTVSMH